MTRRHFLSVLATVPAGIAVEPAKISAEGYVGDSDLEQGIDQRATFVATFTPKQGQELAVETILREVTAVTRKEPGCLRYDLYRGAGAATTFVLFEIYVDETAHQAHRATAHYKAFRAAVSDLLSTPSQAQVLTGLDVVR